MVRQLLNFGINFKKKLDSQHRVFSWFCRGRARDRNKYKCNIPILIGEFWAMVQLQGSHHKFLLKLFEEYGYAMCMSLKLFVNTLQRD